ncbi:MAG TPA: polynucleotide adenylyltransferase PcnB [Candidatus Binataceae bacterium]|nr:polynucleotide adenylyltransferase PcnB [Candidatus Binataceae bacterium]
MEPRILERAEHPVSRRDIDANVLKVLYRLIGAGHVACIVGGGVRDLMLSRKPKDFDIATSAHPQQVRDLFRNSRLIGRRFRLVHVFFGRQNIEVATFRRRSEDVAEGEDVMIRLDNTFGSPEEDAFRRDFTVNALFYDPQSFRVIDFPGGVDDLHSRLIRTIGEPELRMREDPVRMMRAVRFAAKLGFEIEPATRAAIERHRADLSKASVPRVVEETYRTLSQPEAARALVLMAELGLLEAVLPMLSAHLNCSESPLSAQPTIRNMAALGKRIEGGYAPEHSILLAALMLDLRRVTDGAGLLADLRARGYARGDTEQMRLILDAFELLAAPSRRTRRLMRRPYFGEALQFFEMIAPAYGIDEAATHRFLATPPGGASLPPAALPPPSEGTEPAPAGEPRRRRRRRRRGGRGHRRRTTEGHPSSASSDSPAAGHTHHHNGAGSHDPHRS